MDFQHVVATRRMTRNYSSRPVDPAAVDRIVGNAVRAPSAGFSQGWAFLVLDQPADIDAFWSATTSPNDGLNSWLEGMREAPVIVVPMSCKRIYLDRYAEADKGWSDRDEARWPVPYWDIDAGMASLLMLLTAVDEELGACFFGVPTAQLASFREAFGVPTDYMPIGAITIGHPADRELVRGSGVRRARTPLEEVVHRGRW